MNRKNKSLKTLTTALADIEKEIQVLQTFRMTQQQQRFLRQLFGERSYIKQQIAKLTAPPAAPVLPGERQQRSAEANRNRSEKNKRSWRYFEAISENYDLSLSKKQIRSEFTKRRRGLQSDIPDLIWRNPSP
jgi:hypothetical protein